MFKMLKINNFAIYWIGFSNSFFLFQGFLNFDGLDDVQVLHLKEMLHPSNFVSEIEVSWSVCYFQLFFAAFLFAIFLLNRLYCNSCFIAGVRMSCFTMHIRVYMICLCDLLVDYFSYLQKIYLCYQTIIFTLKFAYNFPYHSNFF